jgi:hypothetical protein
MIVNPDATRLVEFILESRNPDGGWGYRAGRQSRLEPTCWATLAVAASGTGDRAWTAESAGVLRLLQRWQRDDGLFAEPGLPPNPGFNGLAALVLLASPRGGPAAERLRSRLHAGLLGSFGIRSREFAEVRQDNSLRGWPWVAGTFSWVEPTAWCMLALKRGERIDGRRVADRARIDEAERLLFDRRCSEGGWNHGNSNALGQRLEPYVPTTAIALLALQDRRDDPGVGQALAYLERVWPREPSGLGTALTALCLSCYGRSDDRVYAALREAERRTRFLEDLLPVSLAAYAFATAHGRPDALSL